MLNDLTVHNMVIGGPAHKSGQIEVGDTICKVDGKEVTMDDYELALQGCDVPGSKVILTLLKPEVRALWEETAPQVWLKVCLCAV